MRHRSGRKKPFGLESIRDCRLLKPFDLESIRDCRLLLPVGDDCSLASAPRPDLKNEDLATTPALPGDHLPLSKATCWSGGVVLVSVKCHAGISSGKRT